MTLARDHFKRPENLKIAIARNWAFKLERMSAEQRRLAEKFINEILFEGEKGNLRRHSVIINQSIFPYLISISRSIHSISYLPHSVSCSTNSISRSVHSISYRSNSGSCSPSITINSNRTSIFVGYGAACGDSYSRYANKRK